MSEEDDTPSSCDENLSITDVPSWLQGLNDGSERNNRRKSLECSSIRISIDDTELAGVGEQYILFVIRVSPGLKSWIIKRRYSDFKILHKSLSQHISSDILAKLPPKRYLFSSIESKFVEERRRQLQIYLSAIVSIPNSWKRSELARFLDNDSNSLIFLWNFERMRKMHDALSTMTIENKSETAKLTTKLNNAREQVKYLQERISRMEMLFLQHASGMAISTFSPKLIRSISCEDTNKSVTSDTSGQQRSHSNNANIISCGNNDFKIGEIYSSSPNSHLSTETSDSIETINSTTEKEKYIINNKLGVENELEAAFLELTTSDKMDLENLKIVIDMASSGRLLSVDNILNDSSDRISMKSIQEVKNVALSIKLQECMRLSEQILEKSDDISDSTSTSIEIESCVDTISVFNDFHISDYLPQKNSLYSSSNSIVDALIPTAESIEYRMQIYHYIRGIIGSTLHGAFCFPVGSFTSNTFLPNGDIDITIFLHYSSDNDSWFAKINEALCYSTFDQRVVATAQYDNRMVVQSVNFVNADVKLVKASINNINVDISCGQIGGLYSQALIEKLDIYIGKNHLLKRSIILIKAWAYYESGRYADGNMLGAIEGRFSTWPFIVTILFIFNKFGAMIECPFIALGYWLEYLSTFDWTNHALTIDGPVSVIDLSPISSYDTVKCNHYPIEIIRELQIRCENTRIAACDMSETRNLDPSYLKSTYVFGDTTNFYKRGFLNIIDPISVKINVSRSVSIDGARAIISMFKAGFSDYVSTVKNCDLSNLGDEAISRHMLSNTICNIQQQRNLVIRRLPLIELDLLGNQLDQIEISIQHAELVLGLVLHESALLRICARLLIDNNPLPIGEIGKLLTQIFKTDLIIKKIKESYGGLKKLIELSSNSNKVKIQLLLDHPFNPTAQVVFTESTNSTYNRSNNKLKFDHEYDYFLNARSSNKDVTSKYKGSHGNQKGSRSKK